MTRNHASDFHGFRIRDLKKIYGEGETAVHALRGVNLDIPAGDIAVLLGPSGSGKSTLLNIVGGLDRATSGTVFLDDLNISDLSDRELTRYRRENVGFIFQFYNLMPSLTARENVELVTEIADDPMDPYEALTMVNLEDRGDDFPSQLSGGQQQRVAIARAIAKKPKILFCDEPTGALDSQTGRAVLHVLRDVNERLGSTVLIVTHAAAQAEMADRVIRFTDGAVSSVTENDAKISPDDIVW